MYVIYKKINYCIVFYHYRGKKIKLYTVYELIIYKLKLNYI